MRARWAGAAIALSLAVPVAAQAHPADWMYRPGAVAAQIGSTQTGLSTFMQVDEQLPGSFTEVGHDPLLGRGMNAAIAVNGRYVYIGSRTDGKNNNANHAGVFVVDAGDPAHPHIVNEMGPPFEGLSGESSRELRVWRSHNVLIVIHTNCGGNGAHQCSVNSRSRMRFYDIGGENGANPQLLFENTLDTHEFFIWEDPKNPDRALMFASSATQNFQI